MTPLFPDLLQLRLRLQRCLTPRLSITGIIRASTGGGIVRFGSVDQVDEEDEMWGGWSSGRVLCGPRPTELDNDCGYGGDGGTGWGSGAPVGTADGRFDGGYPASPPGLSDGNVRGGAFPFSKPGHPVKKAQTTRWTTGAFRRPPSADVRVIDVQRAGVKPVWWSTMGSPAGTPPLGPWGTVRTVLDPARPLAPNPAPAFAGIQPGHGGPAVPAGDVLGAAPAPTSFTNLPVKADVRRERLPQGLLPCYHLSEWVVPEGRWADTGGF